MSKDLAPCRASSRDAGRRCGAAYSGLEKSLLHCGKMLSATKENGKEGKEIWEIKTAVLH